MKVSIITVCLNNADTIEQNILSVSNQSYPNIEHIIIDGGSHDDTFELILRHKHQLAFFSSEPDEGIYDAMNKGLRVATGDIVSFLNADDYFVSQDVIAEVVETMRLKKVNIVFGDVAFFDQKSPKKIVRRYKSGRFKPSLLRWGWIPAHPGFFVTRDVVRNIGEFEASYKIAGDYEYMIRVFLSPYNEYTHLPKVLVKMRLGGVSTKGAWLARNLEVLRACRTNGLKTNLFMILSKYPLKVCEFIFK